VLRIDPESGLPDKPEISTGHHQLTGASMTDEERVTLYAYQVEMEKLFDIAQRLDSQNPELPGAFTGAISERIERQLRASGVI
jgi:hypothetical protein